ncbi:MAG: maleylpyruvate isomerase family mycothiol-dependent enzyme [Acidimicrobiales bacterium]
MESAAAIAAMTASAARISELARSCELSTPVPHLGRWRVRDVVAHLGGVHRWAARIVTTRSMDGPGFTKSKLDGIELCDWFDEGVQALLEAFRANDEDADCPNFNPGSVKNVAWWSRRQAHETTVHRWDVEHALDCTTPIESDLAADGVDEFLDVFVRTRGKQTLIAPLVLATNQPDRAWTLAPAAKPGRLDVVPGRDPEVKTELAGDAEQMLLHLWGRLKLTESELTVYGDLDVASSLTT